MAIGRFLDSDEAIAHHDPHAHEETAAQLLVLLARLTARQQEIVRRVVMGGEYGSALARELGLT
jgi:hypothetical protein